MGNGQRKSQNQPPRRMGRFLRIGLLLLLRRGENYGYILAAELPKLGLPRQSSVHSVIYRLLRRMEEEGLVSSRWETSQRGPRRRLYSITRQGEIALDILMARLLETTALIERLAAVYHANGDVSQ